MLMKPYNFNFSNVRDAIGAGAGGLPDYATR